MRHVWLFRIYITHSLIYIQSNLISSPGNILLLGVEEGKPKLGLIDYGQVKVLTKEERLLFCKLIIALADDDKEDICKLLNEAGYRSQRMDQDIMYKFARVAYDQDNEELTEGKHIQLYMEELHNKDPGKSALVSLYHMISCVRYEDSAIWILHLAFIAII